MTDFKITEAVARAIGRCDIATSMENVAKAALSAIAAEGYAVVPREPTEAMVAAAIQTTGDQLDFGTIYRAMIEASEEGT